MRLGDTEREQFRACSRASQCGFYNLPKESSGFATSFRVGTLTLPEEGEFPGSIAHQATVCCDYLHNWREVKRRKGERNAESLLNARLE